MIQCATFTAFTSFVHSHSDNVSHAKHHRESPGVGHHIPILFPERKKKNKGHRKSNSGNNTLLHNLVALLAPELVRELVERAADEHVLLP